MSLFRNPVNPEDSPEDSPEDNWTPPDYAQPIAAQQDNEGWKPPSYATQVGKKEEPKKSLSERAKEFAGAVARPFQALGQQISEAEDPIAKTVKGVASALPSTTLSDYWKGPAYALRHPIDSAQLTAKALMEAHKEQYEKAKNAPTISEKIGHGAAAALPLLGPMAASAGEDIGSGEYATGIGKTIGLLAPFALHSLRPRESVRQGSVVPPEEGAVKPPLRQTREIPYDQSIKTEPKPSTVVEPPIKQTGSVTTPDRSPNLDPNRFKIGEEPSVASTVKSSEDKQYNDARDRFNMGRDQPAAEEPKPFENPFAKKTEVLSDEDILAGKTTPDKPYSAVFKHIDPNTGEAQFDIQGGPNNGYKGSTRNADSLRKLGIEVPEVPKDAVAAKTGDQLQAEAQGREWKPPDYAQPAVEEAKTTAEEDKIPTNGEQWQRQVDELDKNKAPDIAYQNILSTGTRDKLKKGETWRSKVLKSIQYDKDNELRKQNFASSIPSETKQTEPIIKQTPSPAKQLSPSERQDKFQEYRAQERAAGRKPVTFDQWSNRQSSPPEEDVAFARVGKNEIGPARPLDTRSMEQRFVDSGEEPKIKQTNEPITVNWNDKNPREWTKETIDDMNEYPTGEKPRKEPTVRQTNKPLDFDPQASKIRKIESETDPEIIKDNYNNALVEKEWQKIHGDDDGIEEAGQLHDAALDRYNQLRGKKKISSNEEPSFARSEQGGIKIGQNIKRSAQELTTGYSNPLEGVMVREGMQNAIDATRHLGKNGKIGVKITDDGMEITDNGKGMNRQELETVFSNLHESGKTSEAGATGGKGIGKATYILGGKKFKAETVVFEGGKKIKRTIEGTPDEFSEHVPIVEEEVPLSTPTGTTIQTDFKDNQQAYHARKMLNDIKNHTRGIESKMTLNPYGIDEETSFNGEKSDKVIGTQELEGHEVKISIPKAEELKPRSYMEVKYLNNGMYQFTKTHFLNKETDHMPRNIIVDIHPNAEEGTREYPFPTQRESLKDSIQAKVTQMIDDKLVNPQQQARKSKLKELYVSMSQTKDANTIRKSVLYDPGNRLTAPELKTFNESPTIKAFGEVMDRTIDNILKSTGETKWGDRLEGVGIVLDPGMHGVHIPNPETGKSTILINPFEHIAKNPNDPATASLENVITALHETGHIGLDVPEKYKAVTSEELKDPRIGTYLQSYLSQVMAHGGIDPGHGIGFIKRLAQVYSDYGPKRTFDETDKLTGILTDDSGRYNSEVQKLLQIYKKSRGRAATTEDILSGTGDKQKSSGGGEKPIPPGDKPDGEGASAVDKLFSAISEAKGKVEEQAAINKKERAQRFAASAGVKAEGSAGAAQSLSKMKGSFEKVNPGERLGLNQEDTDSLFTSVKKANITEPEKIRGYTALFKLMNGDGVPVRSELSILNDVFGNGFADKITELHGGLGAVGLKVSKLANTMKSMQNSISLAAPLRHGIGLASRKEFAPAFADMFKFYSNKEYYEAAMKAIQDRPNYLLKKEAGLFLSKAGSMTNAEEEFLNSYVGHIPGVRTAVGASQRAYTGFLNKLRDDVSENMIKTAEGLGNPKGTISGEGENSRFVPSKSTEDIMRFVNIFTGRGELPFGLNKITNELNVALWSPKMIASRIQMITNPTIYTSLPKGMRMEGVKSLFAIASLGTVIDTALAYSGAKISYNILSSDFGKSRFGTKLVDPWGGFQQYIVATARFLAGKTDSKIPTSRAEIAGRFLASKESPMASLVHSLLTARKFTGDSNNPATAGNYTNQYGQKTSIQSEVGKQFVPIFVQDVHDLATSHPDFSENIGLNSVLTGASLVGMSQDYPEKKTGGFSIGKMNVR